MSLQDHVDDVEPTALLLVGFALFVFPEPATSTLGIGLMLLGAAWWFDEWGDDTGDTDGEFGSQ